MEFVVLSLSLLFNRRSNNDAKFYDYPVEKEKK